MKFFVTGATGYVGSAVAAELLAAGHEVAGLTSSEAKIAALEGAGIAPVHGSMADALALDQVVEARRSAELGRRPEVPSYRDGVERAYREWKAGRPEEEE